MLARLFKSFKKPVPSLEQALIDSIQNQQGEKVLVDKKALQFLIEELKNTKTDNIQKAKDLAYFAELTSTITNAINDAKALSITLKTARNAKGIILYLLTNQDTVKDIFKALNIVLKSSYHINSIQEITKKYE